MPKVFIKSNDIDTVIRTIVPEHNCGCDFGNSGINIPKVGNSKLDNSSFFTTVFFKDSSLGKYNFLATGTKIKNALLEKNPDLKNYKKICIEYQVVTSTVADTAFSSKLIGSYLFIKNGCENYFDKVSRKVLMDKTKTIRKQNEFCKKWH